VRYLLIAALFSVAHIGNADPIDEMIQSSMKAAHIPGACIAIFPPKGKPDIRSYGYSNLETGAKYSPKSVQRIASLSKQFCAYSILKLRKEGKLTLADPLSKFFPECTSEFSKITIAHLLAHRSGIADSESEIQYPKDYSPAEFIAMISAKPLTEIPGETYRYNNFGYASLGLIVQKVTGISLREYVTQNIFEPLKMKDTQYFSPNLVIPNRVDAYLWKTDHFENSLTYRDDIFDGSGGIMATIDDMILYEKELRSPKVLDQEILEFQWKAYGEAEFGYGAGWNIQKKFPKIHFHSGSWKGHTSYYLRDRLNGWSILIFRNGAGNEANSAGTWANKIHKMKTNLK